MTATTQEIELARALELALAQIAHKGHHGLAVYDNPRAATVEHDMWELAADRGCEGCKLLLDFQKRNLIVISDTGRLEAQI